jgi:hypothetical protein
MAFLAFATAAPAQRVEGRVIAGVTSFAEDDGSENHATVGGAARFYLSRRWSLEPEYLYMRRDSTFQTDRDHVLWGNVSFDLRDRERAVVPYWFGAPGVIHHRITFGSISSSTTEAAASTGAGVKFVFGRVFVAPQFRFGLADGVFAELTGSLGFVLKR